MKFSYGRMWVTLRPNHDFIPKVLRSCCPFDLEYFYLPTFSGGEHQQLHLMCPVWAVSFYEQLFRVTRYLAVAFPSLPHVHVGKLGVG